MKKYMQYTLFLMLTVVPNLYSQPVIILVCGVGALIMYVLSEKQNDKIKQSDNDKSKKITDLESELRQQEVRSIYLEYRTTYSEDVPFYSEIPQWLVKLSDVYPDWEILFNGCFDVQKGKELLQKFYLEQEKYRENESD